MDVSWIYECNYDEFTNWQCYFDAQIKQKLPKLHGLENVLVDSLDELINLSKVPGGGVSNDSHGRLEEMKKVLKTQRYVSFIN